MRAPSLPAASPATPNPLPPAPSLRRTLRGPALAALVIILLFFAGFGGWAATAQLSSAAIAAGVISPDGNRRTVQHLEGGIIREILVADGAVVSRGQILLVLEDVAAHSDFEALNGRLRTLAAVEARLRAERNGAGRLAFPAWLLEQRADRVVADILDTQLRLFAVRAAVHRQQLAVRRQQIAQLQEEIAGRVAQIESLGEQLGLIDEEIEALRPLVASGVAARPELLRLQRGRAQITGDRGENRALVARARQSIAEIELQLASLESARLDEVNAQLVSVQAERTGVEQDLRSQGDVLDRTAIVAPVSGKVVELRFHTAGGVVMSGEPILDLVPLDEELVIDARVSPIDIDVVHEGLEAQIVLTAYVQRNLPQIVGRVRSVSADAIADQSTGESYFLARIEVDRMQLEDLAQDIDLSPGMPAEVLIKTGERTVIEYLIRPVLDAFRRSLREA